MDAPDSVAPIRTDTVVIGAGPAGLAVAACLQREGVPCIVLERAEAVGARWRTHYDRLHLHTDKKRSALPHFPFPDAAPTYPSRQQVVDYLEAYAAHFGLAPRFGEEVEAVRREGEEWETVTSRGRYRSRCVVVATGYSNEPKEPTWPGREAFGGAVLHSAAYRSGEPFRGQAVLVVGIGNSGAEIALDLAEHGAHPTLAFRTPTNVVPRDILGVPLLAISRLSMKLPPAWADRLNAPLLRLLFGDLTRYGFPKPPYGPMEQTSQHRRVPLIDVGTIAAIKRGDIAVKHAGIERFTEDGVVFSDGTEQSFDAVVLATGYRPAVGAFVEADEALSSGAPRVDGAEPALPGLYFCGYTVSPGGMLNVIQSQAPAIAEAVAAERQPERGTFGLLTRSCSCRLSRASCSSSAVCSRSCLPCRAQPAFEAPAFAPSFSLTIPINRAGRAPRLSQRAWLEMGAVALTGVGHLVFSAHDASGVFIPLAAGGWGGYVGYRAATEPGFLGDLGLTGDGLGPAFRDASLLAAGALAGMAVVGAAQGTFALDADLLPLLALYPVWGVVQQTLVQGFVTRHLAEAGLSPWVVTPLSAVAFGAVHVPNWKLTAATTALGAAYAPLYLRHRNVWPLGLYHGWLGAAYYRWVLDRNPWQEIVDEL